MPNNNEIATDPKLKQVVYQSHDQADFVVQGMDDDDAKTATVAGYAAMYDNKFLVYEFDMGGGAMYRMYRQNMPGMFSRSLSRNPRVVLALNHQNQFAYTISKTLKLSEDKKGLYFEAEVSKENSQANDMLVEMARGTLQEASVMYRIAPGGATMSSETDEQGNVTEVQTVKEGDINHGDVSVVMWGMNPTASSWLQGMVPNEDSARQVITQLQNRWPTLTPAPVAQPEADDVAQTDEPELYSADALRLKLIRSKIGL